MLVLDTDKSKAFIEALETMSPSQELKVLQFTVELLKNAKAYEVRINYLQSQNEELLNKLELMNEEPTEESAYAETDEEEDDGET